MVEQKKVFISVLRTFVAVCSSGGDTGWLAGGLCEIQTVDWAGLCVRQECLVFTALLDSVLGCLLDWTAAPPLPLLMLKLKGLQPAW